MPLFSAPHRFALSLAAVFAGASAQAQPAVDLHPAAWLPDAGAELTFSQPAGATGGALTVRHGGAVLRGVEFTDGTIDFDIREEPDNEGIPGVWFHRRDAQVAENVYLRTDAGCPTSIECVQYAPVAHGNVQWDVYPEFQAAAPVHASGWNHVRLVISGRRMQVFVNAQAAPSLIVGRLEGDAASGGLQLWGDATYANVVLAPGAVADLDPQPLPDPSAGDAAFLREWRLAPVGQLARGSRCRWKMSRRRHGTGPRCPPSARASSTSAAHTARRSARPTSRGCMRTSKRTRIRCAASAWAGRAKCGCSSTASRCSWRRTRTTRLPRGRGSAAWT